VYCSIKKIGRLCARTGLFTCLHATIAVVVVYLAERLNALSASHWQRFAGQNYFDSNGVFVSTVLSAPLVFDMFVILVRKIRFAAPRRAGCAQ